MQIRYSLLSHHQTKWLKERDGPVNVFAYLIAGKIDLRLPT